MSLRPSPAPYGHRWWVLTALRSVLGALLGVLLVLVIS